MQTWLPYPNFSCSVICLTSTHLEAQVRDAMQLINEAAVEHSTRTGWSRHPAAAMWRGYLPALALYASCICRELKRRGRMAYAPESFLLSGHRNVAVFYWSSLPAIADDDSIALPPWLGRPDVHASHRAALLASDQGEHYATLGWTELAGRDVVWPSAVPEGQFLPGTDGAKLETARQERELEIEAAGLRDDRVLLETLGSQERFAWHEARKRADPEHLNPYRHADRQRMKT